MACINLHLFYHNVYLGCHFRMPLDPLSFSSNYFVFQSPASAVSFIFWPFNLPNLIIGLLPRLWKFAVPTLASLAFPQPTKLEWKPFIINPQRLPEEKTYAHNNPHNASLFWEQYVKIHARTSNVANYPSSSRWIMICVAQLIISPCKD